MTSPAPRPCRVAVPPRAAYSHSASDGSRPPIEAQYVFASFHDTLVTGSRSFDFVFRYAASVVSVSASQKPRVISTTCAGFSSSSQSGSPAEQPIVKLPGGIHR